MILLTFIPTANIGEEKLKEEKSEAFNSKTKVTNTFASLVQNLIIFMLTIY